MRGDLPGGQSLGEQRDDHLVDTGEALLPLGHDPRFELGVAVARHVDLHRPDVGEDRLGAGAVARVAGTPPGRVVLVVAQVVGDLAFQGRLQQPLGQLLQHPALTGELQATGADPADQLVNQLLVQALQGGFGLGVLGVLHAGHHLGHQVRILDQELHRAFYNPHEIPKRARVAS
ncbi:hypothetical protein GCM10010185_42450 [Saccharothrix coeruleofusca]|uniref:Uncharacterized protein n=1 Tax=Saccharothrix coeruleofusca TaxID=33919 RepID=A0A918ANJ2_9PSEU|nr:hypothetical protein GCM10010185_42450 [Saccharothrix coeruleofusca]